MALLFDSVANFSVTTSEQDIFTPIVGENYYGIYVFTHNISTNDIRIIFYVYDPVGAVYREIDRYEQTGTSNDTAHFFPLLPHRRFKVTVMRTIGSNYNINADIITQPS